MEKIKYSFRDYLLLEKKYSPHTVTAYLNDLEYFEVFINEVYHQDNLLDVNYSQIRSWIVSLSDDGISNTSINRKISSLKSFYKFLLKVKQITVTPLQKHQSLKSPKKLQVPFSEKELDKVLNAVEYPEGFDGVRDKLVIELFYATGIRRSELIHLKLQDVNLANGTIKVLGKRNKERIVPILPITEKLIRVYLSERSKLEEVSDGSYFFLKNNGIKLSDSFVYRLINCYLSNVSEKVKTSPHILRHTFATHLLNNGADINSVKELLGHSSLASTQVYTHNSLSGLKKVYGEAHPRNKK